MFLCLCIALRAYSHMNARRQRAQRAVFVRKFERALARANIARNIKACRKKCTRENSALISGRQDDAR